MHRVERAADESADQTAVRTGGRPYDWDPQTGLSDRFIPGRAGGMHTVTGLAHDEGSKVAYDSAINERASSMRSRTDELMLWTSSISGSVRARGREKNPASRSCTADGATGRQFDMREHWRPG